MSNKPPEYCPYCGSPLNPVNAPTAYRCESCEQYVFHNPTPSARVLVLDGDELLLVEIAEPARLKEPDDTPGNPWATPGGKIEAHEQPAETAARELEEETNLTVAPADLTLFESVGRELAADIHVAAFLFAVDRAQTTGPLEAASDASDARFWTPEELAASPHEFRDAKSEPQQYSDLEWLHDNATNAIRSRSQ